jgi:multidrug efflux pump subunit AcrB
MEKKVETAGDMLNPEVSGGMQSYKEAVYNFLGNLFGWLSTHQGIAIVLIIIVLGIIVWLILRAKKFRRQFNDEVYTNKKEIGKKDALIEEQEKKLTNLQKKLADQQGVVSEALLRTIRTLTGYDADQLPIFFRSLTQISENPLQKADHQAITAPVDQHIEEERNDSIGINDVKEKINSNDDISDDDSLKDSNATEKLDSGDDSSKTTEKFVPNDGSLENNAAKEENASGKDSPEKNDSKKEKLTSNDDPDEASNTNKPVEG